jgi:hypothetical protein
LAIPVMRSNLSIYLLNDRTISEEKSGGIIKIIIFIKNIGLTMFLKI